MLKEEALGSRPRGNKRQDTANTSPVGEFIKPLLQNLELPVHLRIKLNINIRVLLSSQANVQVHLPSHPQRNSVR